MYCKIKIKYYLCIEKNEEQMITFEQFSRQYVFTNEKKGYCRLTQNFYDRFQGMTLSQAYQAELVRWAEATGLSAKVREFEQFLQEQGCEAKQSSISESRYYFYNGVKYRFSAHIYPTGSMTSRWEDGSYNVIDLAADPELINEINF